MLKIPKENKVLATQMGKEVLLAIFKGRTKIKGQAAAKWRHQKTKKLSYPHYGDLTRFIHGKQKIGNNNRYCKILLHMWEKDKSPSPTTSKMLSSFVFKLCTTHFFGTQVFSISDLHKRLNEHNCCLTMHSYRVC